MGHVRMKRERFSPKISAIRIESCMLCLTRGKQLDFGQTW